jgi:hypothetical protein
LLDIVPNNLKECLCFVDVILTQKNRQGELDGFYVFCFDFYSAEAMLPTIIAIASAAEIKPLRV